MPKSYKSGFKTEFRHILNVLWMDGWMDRSEIETMKKIDISSKFHKETSNTVEVERLKSLLINSCKKYSPLIVLFTTFKKEWKDIIFTLLLTVMLTVNILLRVKAILLLTLPFLQARFCPYKSDSCLWNDHYTCATMEHVAVMFLFVLFLSV